MSIPLVVLLTLAWLAIAVGAWLVWQLLRQNGRILLRLDDIEERLHELEFGAATEPLDASTSDPERANRFGNRSLARSKINRSGLKAGTTAPDFRLPRLEGGELSLSEHRGRRVLLVFSDPQCGPCNDLVPRLQEFHRDRPEIALVMVSRGDQKHNRAKAIEHGISFAIGLQRQWEISRRYAMFATPTAYLIDEAGVIAADVAVGAESIMALLKQG